MLLDGLGGDLVGEGADLELVVAEEVGIVGGGEVGGQFADLGVDGLADGSGEVLDLGLLLGRSGVRWHGGLRFRGSGFPQKSPPSPLVYKNSTNFQDAHRLTLSLDGTLRLEPDLLWDKICLYVSLVRVSRIPGW